VSGISPSQCSLVTGFLRPLMEIERRTAGEWSVVVLERAPDATNAPNLRTGALSDPSP
jgi:hypothetical protein